MTRDEKQIRAIVNRCKTMLDHSHRGRDFDMLYIRPYFGQAGTWNRKIYRESQLLCYLLVKKMRKYNSMFPEHLRVVYYWGYDEFFERFEKEIPRMEGFPDLTEED